MSHYHAILGRDVHCPHATPWLAFVKYLLTLESWQSLFTQSSMAFARGDSILGFAIEDASADV
jgi:hypothetical protein